MNTITEKLVVAKADGVGLIRLNQPEKRNAISYSMWQGIAAALEDFEADDAVRVVVMEGAGERAFSAGADISEFEEKRGTDEAIEEYNRTSSAARDRLVGIPKPTIAKIRGYCIGGGLGTALCCDLRIAAQGSQFGIPAAKLGLGYGYDSLRPLVDLVGPSNAKEILYTARRFSAAEALGMGLVNRVVEPDELDDYIIEYASTIAGNAPLTIRACKGVVTELARDPAERDRDRADALVAACFASEDYKEGRRAFMEKRKPSFQGR